MPDTKYDEESIFAMPQRRDENGQRVPRVAKNTTFGYSAPWESKDRYGLWAAFRSWDEAMLWAIADPYVSHISFS